MSQAAAGGGGGAPLAVDELEKHVQKKYEVLAKLGQLGVGGGSLARARGWRCRQRQRGAMSSYVNKGGDVGAMTSSL